MVSFPVRPFSPQHSEVQFRWGKCTINQTMSWIVMLLESVKMKNLCGIIPISWVFTSVPWSTHYNRPFICYANSCIQAHAKQRKAYNEAGEDVVWGGCGCAAGLLWVHRLRHVTGSCHLRWPYQHKYATSVSAYINKCTEDVSVRQNIINRATQKPWMTDEVHKILKAHNSAFKSNKESSQSKKNPGLLPQHH